MNIIDHNPRSNIYGFIDRGDLTLGEIVYSLSGYSGYATATINDGELEFTPASAGTMAMVVAMTLEYGGSEG